MKNLAKNLAIAGMLVVAASAAGAQERKVQFAGEAGFFSGDEYTGSGLLLGFRVDFNLSKSIMISPELLLSAGQDYGWGVMFPSCTLNYRLGTVFFGAGIGTIAVFEAPLMAKIQVGAKSRHWTLAGFIQTGAGSTFAGVTAGYIF
jgi:hypothetical protein